MLTEKQRAALNSSNRTIAVIAKLSRDTHPEANKDHYYAFENGATGVDGRVQALDFFAKVQPALYGKVGDAVRVGNSSRNKINLLPPGAATDKMEPIPITIDSPLLDAIEKTPGQSDYESIQKRGGQLFRDLLKNLDIVTRYTHSNFPRALFMYAANYAFVFAADKLRHEGAEWANQTRWLEFLSSRPKLIPTIIHYFTCYPEDEKQVDARMEAAFLEQVKGDTSSASTVPAAFLDGLRAGKACLINEDRTQDLLANGRSVWESLVQEGATNSATPLAWLEKYHLADDHLRLEGVDAGNATFFAYYRMFYEASNAVHRFSRSAPLHSYLFCYLASKYVKHDHFLDDFNDAAQEIFRRGVESQPNRIHGLTQRQRTLEKQWLDADYEAPESLAGSGRYLEHQGEVLTAALEHLRPSSVFTIADLTKKLDGNWRQVMQSIEGPVAEFNKLLQDVAGRFIAIRNVVVGATQDEDQPHTIEDTAAFAAELERANGTDRESFLAIWTPFLDRLESRAKGIELCEAFTRCLGLRLKQEHGEFWSNNVDRIQQDEAAVGQLLRIGHELNIAIAGEDNAAMPVPVLGRDIVTKALPPSESDPEQQFITHQTVKLLDSQQSDYTHRSPIDKSKCTLAADTRYQVLVADRVQTAESSEAQQLEDLEREEEPGRVAGEVVGEALLKQDGTLEVTVEAAAREQLIQSNKEVVVRTENEDVSLAEFDVDAAEVAKSMEMELIRRDDATKRSAVRLAQDTHKIAKYQDQVQQRYIAVSNDPVDVALRKAVRSTMLGNYFHSAPKGAVNLGKPDVGNVLGLIMDMAQLLGDGERDEGSNEWVSTAAADLFDNTPAEPGTTLDKINLSCYFPVSDYKQMSEVLSYHYNQCQSLNRVADSLRDLRDIRQLFDSLCSTTGVRIVIINSTVAEHAALKSRDKLVFSRDAPLQVYLGRSSGANEGLGKLSDRMLASIGPNGSPNVQVPLFVSPQRLDPTGVAAAIIDDSLIQMPVLSAEAAKSETTEKTTIVARELVQTNPWLALCASLAAETCRFGTIENDRRWEMPDAVRDFAFEELGVRIDHGDPLNQVFRELWFQHPMLLPNLAFTKLLNMVITSHWNENGQEDKLAWHQNGSFGKVLIGLDQAKEIRHAFDTFRDVLGQGELQIYRDGSWIDNAKNVSKLPITEDYGLVWPRSPEFAQRMGRQTQWRKAHDLFA